MKTWQNVSQALYLFTLICVIGVVVNYLGAVPSCAEPQPAASAAASGQKTKAPPAKFVGSETCEGCHNEAGSQFHQQAHGLGMIAREAKGQGYLCEGCHGPGSNHVDDPSAESAKPLRETANNGKGCLSCHNTRLSPTKWQLSNHHRAGVGCIACHAQVVQPKAEPTAQVKKPGDKTAHTPNLLPHADLVRKPTEETCLACHKNTRGEFALPYHHPIPEKRLTCSDCHDAHRPVDNQLKRDVCVKCHADQRGPFRFAHAAISGNLTDACVDCHRPHGSPNQRLLKFSNRGLCLQCHADKALHFPGRLCWDCHSALHGSNNSPLFFRE